MAQRNQLAGLLGGLYAGDARDAEHVALAGAARLDEFQRLWQHFYPAAGDGDAVRVRFGGHVDHVGLALGVEMGQ